MKYQQDFLFLDNVNRGGKLFYKHQLLLYKKGLKGHKGHKGRKGQKDRLYCRLRPLRPLCPLSPFFFF